MDNYIHRGDCLDIMRSFPENSFDAVVTDPPYHLTAMTKRFGKEGAKPAKGPAFQRHNAGFMQMTWDGGDIAFDPKTWAEALRVLKPGGHLVAMGGSRTFHRLVVAIEDADFEVKDTLVWLYGQGMPKGLRPVPHMWNNLIKCQSKDGAPLVVQSSPPFQVVLPEGKTPTVHALAVIRPEGVPVLLTETGGVEDSRGVTATLLSESQAKTVAIALNTTSWWKESSVGAFDAVNMSTTETMTRLTTDQTTSFFWTGLHTDESIRLSVSPTNGSPWPVLNAKSNSRDSAQRWHGTPVLSVLGNATDNPCVKWRGYNVALKPAMELICLARKPLSEKSVAANVLTHGTGAINIDASRIGAPGGRPHRVLDAKTSANGAVYAGRQNPGTGYDGGSKAVGETSLGRWPANALLSHSPECVEVGTRTVKGRAINTFDDGAKPFGGGAGHPYTSEQLPDEIVPVWECTPDCAVRLLDEQTGTLTSGYSSGFLGEEHKSVAMGVKRAMINPDVVYADSGGASRFFYCSKASRSERNMNVEGGNQHPTVKPLALMKWLITLVTPPGGVVLDPFLGSGTTALAAQELGFGWVGIEKESEYVAIAKQRLGISLMQTG